MYPPHQHKPCLVDGCTAQTHGKSYCHAHNKTKGASAVISGEQRAQMQSDCCEAACEDGPRHEYGRQYCHKCHSACCWHPHKIPTAKENTAAS